VNKLIALILLILVGCKNPVTLVNKEKPEGIICRVQMDGITVVCPPISEDIKVYRDPRDQLVHKAQWELRVHKVHKAHKVQREL